MERSADHPQVEITPQMIEAGVIELRRHQIGEPLEEVIRDVFLMMALESAAFSNDAT